MKLSKDQVKKVAKLANLDLSGAEEEKFSGQLSKILDYIEELNVVDTSAVEPTFNVIDRSNVFREDKEEIGLSQEEALANAPSAKDGFFVSKGVFKE